MRQLIKKATLKHAVPAGVTVAIFCIPYLLQASGNRLLLWLRILFIFPICIVLFQVAIAWSPRTSERPTLQLPRSFKCLLASLLFTIIVLAMYILYVDPQIKRTFAGSMEKALLEVVIALPWVTLFQPLVLIAALYGFVVRLLRNAIVAVIFIVFTHQLLIFLHYNSLVSSQLLFALMTITGIRAVLSAAAYHFMGYVGPILVSFIIFSRFFFYCIF